LSRRLKFEHSFLPSCSQEIFRGQPRFFLADRSLPWPLVGASLFATNIGAEHRVGLSGDGYRFGLSAGAVELTTCCCLGFAALFLLLFLFCIRNRGFTTLEFLETRYRLLASVLFSGLMLAISITTKMAFHLYAGAGVTWACRLGRNECGLDGVFGREFGQENGEER
jgi:uncharacterized sodium:solute symporter family permease YidK